MKLSEFIDGKVKEAARWTKVLGKGLSDLSGVSTHKPGGIVWNSTNLPVRGKNIQPSSLTGNVSTANNFVQQKQIEDHIKSIWNKDDIPEFSYSEKGEFLKASPIKKKQANGFIEDKIKTFPLKTKEKTAYFEKQLEQFSKDPNFLNEIAHNLKFIKVNRGSLKDLPAYLAYHPDAGTIKSPHLGVLSTKNSVYNNELGVNLFRGASTVGDIARMINPLVPSQESFIKARKFLGINPNQVSTNLLSMSPSVRKQHLHAGMKGHYTPNSVSAGQELFLTGAVDLGENKVKTFTSDKQVSLPATKAWLKRQNMGYDLTIDKETKQNIKPLAKIDNLQIQNKKVLGPDGYPLFKKNISEEFDNFEDAYKFMDSNKNSKGVVKLENIRNGFGDADYHKNFFSDY